MQVYKIMLRCLESRQCKIFPNNVKPTYVKKDKIGKKLTLLENILNGNEKLNEIIEKAISHAR